MFVLTARKKLLKSFLGKKVHSENVATDLEKPFKGYHILVKLQTVGMRKHRNDYLSSKYMEY